MKRVLLSLVLGPGISTSFSQHLSLPEPVTNNAVVALKKNKHDVLYSFYGLDESKSVNGIHRKVFRVDLDDRRSQFIGLVPDALGRLASSASAIHNKAYLVGGYAVFPNGKEKSSPHLYIFDPETEHFSFGTPLPMAIDDHVQCVWRDSLLYVISGWCDSVSVRTVQVYRPGKRQWRLAIPLPDDKEAKVFGSSGIIVGDTIYMLGGAMFDKYYPPSRSFYKGAIDPRDPYRITWSRASDYPGEFRYRSAAYAVNDFIYFFGGSNETYNYNGVSYAEKRAVEPNQTLVAYSTKTGKFTQKSAPHGVMDLRNIAQVGPQTFLVGGMGQHQQVLSQVTLLENPK